MFISLINLNDRTLWEWPINQNGWRFQRVGNVYQ